MSDQARKRREDVEAVNTVPESIVAQVSHAGSHSSCQAGEYSRHAVQVVDAARVVDLEAIGEEWLHKARQCAHHTLYSSSTTYTLC